jgi:hypothetical protein
MEKRSKLDSNQCHNEVEFFKEKKNRKIRKNEASWNRTSTTSL